MKCLLNLLTYCHQQFCVGCSLPREAKVGASLDSDTWHILAPMHHRREDSSMTKHIKGRSYRSKEIIGNPEKTWRHWKELKKIWAETSAWLDNSNLYLDHVPLSCSVSFASKQWKKESRSRRHSISMWHLHQSEQTDDTLGLVEIAEHDQKL